MEESNDYPSCSLQNSFISTLDHLPCDIVRSLWLIQSCNLKIDKYKQELNELLEKYATTTTTLTNEESYFLKRIVELKKRIEYLSRETIQESRSLNNQLITHKLNLLEEMNQLKKIEISKHNLIDDIEMKELRQQLKTHYNEHPLVSQMEAVQEQKDLIISSNDKSQTNDKNGGSSDSSSNTNGILKNKIKDEPEKSKLKLILRIPKQDKVIKPKNKKIVKKVQKRPTKRNTVISKDDKKSKTLRKKVPQLIELKEEPEKEEEQEDTTLYCFCKQPSFGNMISCDNESSCPNGEWFHYKCVGILNRVVALKYTTGKESWYCSENCKSMALQAKQSKKQKNGKRRKRRSHW